MFRGLLTSFVGHALLLLYALFEIQHAPPDLPPMIPIEATIITPSELTRLKQGDPTSKEMEAKAKDEPQPEISKKEAEKPKPITAPPPRVGAAASSAAGARAAEDRDAAAAEAGSDRGKARGGTARADA